MLGLWSFRFLLFFLLVLMTQPHFRFHQLIPLRLGNLTIGMCIILHVMHCLSTHQKLLRFGPATKVCLALIALSMTSHYFNPHQFSTDWNVHIDGMVKVSIFVIILEAQITSVNRAISVLITLFLGTLWWLKGGVRLSAAGATWGSDDRLMGANVSIIQNPNDFAYLTIFMLPIYFYFFQISKTKYLRLFFLGCMCLAAVIALKTGSRTGLIALVSVIAILTPRLVREHTGVFFGALAAFLVIINTPQLVGPRNVERFRTIPDSLMEMVGLKAAPAAAAETADEGSARIRWVKMAAAWNVIMKYPLLGVGTRPHGYVYDGNINAGGMVHNEILMAGRHMGLGGMLIYFMALYLPFRLASRLKSATANGIWPEVHAFSTAIQIMLVVVVMGGMLSPSLFHFPHMAAFAAMSGMYYAVQEGYPALLNNPAGVEAWTDQGLPQPATA